MTAIPNALVPLFGSSGEATDTLRKVLTARGLLPRGALVDAQGRAQPIFRKYLSGIANTPLPGPNAALADEQGRPTRALSLLLSRLP